MTLIRGKVPLWLISMALLVMPVTVVAREDTDSSAPPGQTGTAASADLGRFVVQAPLPRESARGASADVGDLRLSLREAVLLALKNNLDIAIAGYNPKITAENIIIRSEERRVGKECRL